MFLSRVARRSAPKLLAVTKNAAAAWNRLAPIALSSRYSNFSTATSTKTDPVTAHPTAMHPAMFCRQCEQTADHYACTSIGVCGKTSETAACQDTLMEMLKSVSTWADQARTAGVSEADLQEANVWTLAATFSTLTNVNFSDERIAEFINQGQDLQTKLKTALAAAGGTPPTEAVASLDLSNKTVIELEEYGQTVSIPVRQEAMGNPDAFSLNEISTYGLKGACAYAMHCHQLGILDEVVMTNIHKIFRKLASPEPDMDGLMDNVMLTGETAGMILKNLDGAHADTLGAPEPTEVRTTVVEGKCILVSGHDMLDLHELLEQTQGKGINVYTHGEMQPAHAYPELKKFTHLVANYGTAWQNQKFEFAAFPGPIVMTTNCIIEPRRNYKNRIYTMNEVGVDGVAHIENRDFSKVIAQALEEKGFPRTIEPAEYLTTGFNHRAVLPLADKVLEAAANGQLSRILLIGGCDGSQWERSYFTDLAEQAPDDSLILTLGCAKNRVIHSEKLKGATLANGLPRVLDMGQCNDSYSAIVVATELAKALDCSINDLPLSLALSHLEQKAAAVLLTLLSMGVKNIRLGPSLPAYVTPNVLRILQSEYNLMGTGDATEDLAAMMEGK